MEDIEKQALTKEQEARLLPPAYEKGEGETRQEENKREKRVLQILILVLLSFIVVKQIQLNSLLMGHKSTSVLVVGPQGTTVIKAHPAFPHNNNKNNQQETHQRQVLASAVGRAILYAETQPETEAVAVRVSKVVPSQPQIDAIKAKIEQLKQFAAARVKEIMEGHRQLEEIVATE